MSKQKNSEHYNRHFNYLLHLHSLPSVVKHFVTSSSTTTLIPLCTKSQASASRKSRLNVLKDLARSKADISLELGLAVEKRMIDQVFSSCTIILVFSTGRFCWLKAGLFLFEKPNSYKIKRIDRDGYYKLTQSLLYPISCFHLQCIAGAVAQHRPYVIYRIQTTQTLCCRRVKHTTCRTVAKQPSE